MIVPGPRQAAKIAAEYHALDREISELRTRASGLAKQRDEREAKLLAYAKLRGDGETYAVKLAAGDWIFHFGVAEKRSSPSYKSELLRFIEPADLQQIIDAQPTKEELQFAAFAR